MFYLYNHNIYIGWMLLVVIKVKLMMKCDGGISNIVIILFVVLFVVAGGATVYLVTREPSVENGIENEKLLIGIMPKSCGVPSLLVQAKAAEWVLEDMGIETITVDPGLDPAEQVKMATDLINMGIDGLVWSPADPAGAKVVSELCAEHGVVNIATDSDVYSADTSLYITVGNAEVCSDLAKLIVADLELDENGEPYGLVLGVSCPFRYHACRVRMRGFEEVFDTYPNIEFHYDEETPPGKAPSIKVMMDLIGIYGKPDAVVANDGVILAGCIEGMEKLWGEIPLRGEEGHVIAAAPFAEVESLPMYKAGKVDYLLEGNSMFYSALGAYYCVKGIREGIDSLPKAGDIITADMVSLENITKPRKGFNPLARNVWAPAEVIRGPVEAGHPTVQVKGFIVNENNMDTPNILANFIELYL